MKHQTSNIEFTELHIDKVFDRLISVDTELNNYFKNYLLEEYKSNKSSRLNYSDIAEIARFIVDKKNQGKHLSFQNSLIRLK